MSNDDVAVLQAGDKRVELPLTEATEGNSGYGISSLMKETGNTTLDPGFTNTASCVSRITFIDGDQGILRYRGYPIDDLAENSHFLEVCYLVIHGELPSSAELEEFEQRILAERKVHEDVKNLFSAFPRSTHPMAILSAGIMVLESYAQDTVAVRDEKQVEAATVRMLAQVPTLAAYIFRHVTGQEFIEPDLELGYVENFLRMCFGDSVEESQVKAMDTLFVLHAEHEQNCSTSTVRLVGSADTNLYASVAAGVNALWGPRHGGANQAVLEMLNAIKDSDNDTATFMEKVKKKEDGVKLMGFGHRVYKNYDPRATIVKKHTDEILASTDNELLDIAKGLEEVALNDDYFKSRKLYPNVDFYTGLIYEAFGFPMNYFTVLFALGRLPGWIAQWREMMTDPDNKIGRPRQVYIGETERKYQKQA
ncbi:citrate synthase [Naumannella sp. ID2617S]|uniref:Citrate synthase n=1 Tax=Enemella dayhoffiae TaxID=2016507 RepID=A0A255HCC0_9ACTN|nr:citrate synthase [Enemella dayhoffiae]NNG18149.1 citrate synthase [Naumannella sp. ID2617S]OYO23934.1 citrate (Si)-synthase [Enemella dayhoffiae]